MEHKRPKMTPEQIKARYADMWLTHLSLSNDEQIIAEVREESRKTINPASSAPRDNGAGPENEASVGNQTTGVSSAEIEILNPTNQNERDQSRNPAGHRSIIV